MTVETVLAFASSAVAVLSAMIATWQAISARRQVAAATLQVEYARAQAESARRQAVAAEEQVRLLTEQLSAERADSHAAALQRQASLVIELETISAELALTLRSTVDSIRLGGLAWYNSLVDGENATVKSYFACLQQVKGVLHGTLAEAFQREVTVALAALGDVNTVTRRALSWMVLVSRVARQRSFAHQRIEDFRQAMSRASAVLPTDTLWSEAAPAYCPEPSSCARTSDSGH